jgi:hypothetical protein
VFQKFGKAYRSYDYAVPLKIVHLLLEVHHVECLCLTDKANCQQGLAATCEDHWIEVWSTKFSWRVLVWRMSP